MQPGESLSNGPRLNILNPSLWRKFKNDTGINIEYSDFIRIILKSNKKITEKVCNNILGFKLPENLGYLVISAYKPKKKNIDFYNSKKYGVTVYHQNFHSKGMDARIMWYVNGISYTRNVAQYKFIADRYFTKAKSDKLKSGKVYSTYSYKDFRDKKIKVNLDKIFYGNYE